MRYALMTEPQQGLSYAEILAIARTAEESGIEAYFRSDHYGSFPGPAGAPTTDAWTTLAGLARETSRIRLGVLVSPVTFRIPGSFAKVIQTVDEMSGGRIEAGFGAGWNETEHGQLGIPFPDPAERFAMLAEQMRILDGLWREPDGWTHEGRHWQVRGSRRHGLWSRRPGGRPHVILGGSGKSRLVRLAARYADELNIVSATPKACAAAFEALDGACRERGRDPATITRSAMTGVLVAETERDLADRVAALREMEGQPRHDGGAWLEQRRGRWVMGTPDQAHERVAALARAGVQRVMLQDFIPRDLDHVRLIGRVFAG